MDLQSVAAIATIIGTIITIILILASENIRRHGIRFINLIKRNNVKKIDTSSKYTIQRIPEIVLNELKKSDLNMDALNILPGFTINDLAEYCRIFHPNKSKNFIFEKVSCAREVAFTTKYAEPKEDEKLINMKLIGHGEINLWYLYFYDLLKIISLNNLDEIDILDVGICNGKVMKPIYENINKLNGIDISKKAIDYCKLNFPKANLFVDSAENLTTINNSSIDLYLSFRTYQSSYFGTKKALIEAYRVLRSGGFIVISIPIMYARKDGTLLKGLQPPNKLEPTMEYAYNILERIRELLDICNFVNITDFRKSPFELYIYAQRK
jgi:SAM-dependent methyltransferase